MTLIGWMRTHPKILILNLAVLLIAAGFWFYARTSKEEQHYFVEESDEYVVVLDIGHGGRDPGAVVPNVRTPDGSLATIYERGMVMDVAARLMGLLAAHENIAVLPTATDESGELLVAKQTIPIPPAKTFLRVTPRVDLQEIPTTVAVNLRWMLANHIERAWRGSESQRPRRIIFVSLHMDEHKDRGGGLTIYTPPSVYERIWPEGNHSYQRFAEARAWSKHMNEPAGVRFDVERSNELARLIATYFERHQLGVFNRKVYHNEVRRGGGDSFVPAVIRYNSIETRVLLELANLSDPVDQQGVIDPVYRERMAWAIYGAVMELIGRRGAPGPDSSRADVTR